MQQTSPSSSQIHCTEEVLKLIGPEVLDQFQCEQAAVIDGHSTFMVARQNSATSNKTEIEQILRTAETRFSEL